MTSVGQPRQPRSGCCDCSVLHILDVDAYTGGERNRQHPLALASLGEMEREPIAVVETSVLNKVSNERKWGASSSPSSPTLTRRRRASRAWDPSAHVPSFAG